MPSKRFGKLVAGGRILDEGKVLSDPEALIAWL